MECFAGVAAVGGVGAKSAFSYNRENFQYDRKLRMRKEFQLYGFRIDQAELWREDVRDLISLTECKMHVYLLVNVLMLGFCVVLWCEGRLPETTPNWLMMGSALSITGAFIFLLLSIWMSMQAAVAAQAYEARILTQLVRLPIPTWQELEACRTCGSDFEKMSSQQMFRVPFVTGRQEDQLENFQAPASRVAGSGGGSACRIPQAPVADPWGLERCGNDIKELGTRHGSDVAKLRHVKVARQAMVYWQSYDAFARISQMIGVIELLLAMSYYVLGYVVVQDNCRSAATYGVVVLSFMAASIIKMDMSLSVAEARAIQILLFLCPALSCIAAYHWSGKQNFRMSVAETFIVMAFFAHGFFLALMVRASRITAQDNGTLLPLAFRSVLYLDVFGWLRDDDDAEDDTEHNFVKQQSEFFTRQQSSEFTQNVDLDVELGGPRPATESVKYTDSGQPVASLPHDHMPEGAVQDLRDKVGAPQGSFDANSDVFFSAAHWMPGEASCPAVRCICGSIFMVDSCFCPSCGVKRPVGEGVPADAPDSDEEFASGHEDHNPGYLPWRVFSSMMVLLCLAWLLGGCYHLAAVMELIQRDSPLIWEVEPIGKRSDEPWEREVKNPITVKGLFSRLHRKKDHFSVEVAERVEHVTTTWPHENVRPVSLACNSDGTRFVMVDQFRVFTATLPQKIIRKRATRSANRFLRSTESHLLQRQPLTVVFKESACPKLLGESLQDVAVACSYGNVTEKSEQDKPTAPECRALVLHRQGRSVSSCELGNGTHASTRQAPGVLVANVAHNWLETERRSKTDGNRGLHVPSEEGTTASESQLHLRLEKTVAFSLNTSCWSGSGAVPGHCTGAFVGTSRGRVVQLQTHSTRAELVPSGSLDEEDGEQATNSLRPGAVRALVGRFLGILEDKGQKIQVLDVAEGGRKAGKIKLPEAQPAVAFCAGGGHIYFLHAGPSPQLLRVPLPQELQLQ